MNDLDDNTKYCAYCHGRIEDHYLMVGDNYLQTHYFDGESDNIFCCKSCICLALSVLEVDDDGNNYPI